jgi:hypothetical protein
LRGLRELLINLLLEQIREKRKNLKETSPVMWKIQLSLIVPQETGQVHHRHMANLSTKDQGRLIITTSLNCRDLGVE